jgi:hypothetical protein
MADFQAWTLDRARSLFAADARFLDSEAVPREVDIVGIIPSAHATDHAAKDGLGGSMLLQIRSSQCDSSFLVKGRATSSLATGREEPPSSVFKYLGCSFFWSRTIIGDRDSDVALVPVSLLSFSLKKCTEANSSQCFRPA